MAATKRNAGLTSAIPRPTLNDEDLVRIENVRRILNRKFMKTFYLENSRLQKIPPSAYLPNFIHNSTQFHAL